MSSFGLYQGSGLGFLIYWVRIPGFSFTKYLKNKYMLKLISMGTGSSIYVYYFLYLNPHLLSPSEEDMNVMLLLDPHMRCWVRRSCSWCHDNKDINSRKSPRGRCLGGHLFRETACHIPDEFREESVHLLFYMWNYMSFYLYICSDSQIQSQLPFITTWPPYRKFYRSPVVQV